METLSLSSSVLDRLTTIVTALVASLRVRVRERAVEAGLGEGVCRRLERARTRVEVLVHRLLAGTLLAWARARVSRPRGARSAETRRRIGAVTRGWASMPRRFGWLCGLVPCTERYRDSGGLYGAQLAALLAEPEMRRLLALDPRIGKALRPMCRMLKVALALLEVSEAPEEIVVAPPPPAVVPVAPVAPVAEPARAEPPIIFWRQQKWAQ